MAEPARGPDGPRVVILGLPYFGRMLEGVLRGRGWRAQFAEHPGRDPRRWASLATALARADVLYLIGSRADRRSLQARLLRWWRRPCVIHWVGTDVVFAAEAHARGELSERVVDGATHWCDAPWLGDELRAIGIEADYVSLPVVGVAKEAPPLPRDFRVLLYLPLDSLDRSGHDAETVLRLPGAFPDVAFTLIYSPPDSLPQPVAQNLRPLPWVTDMDALYRETTVYVRLPHHDGTAHTVVEALSRGRHVIWTEPLAGCIAARGFDEVQSALRALLEAQERGQLGLNERGIEVARSKFDPGVTALEIDRRLRALLRARR